MAIGNFIPELWEASILRSYEKALVYAQPSVVNRDYEGRIRQMGDTVHISSLSDPTIRTYSKTADLTIEDLTDADLSIVIDQGDYYAFRVNDIDEAQAAGSFRSPAMDMAGQGLADKLDQFVAKMPYASALAGNKLGRKTVVNNDGGKAGAGQTTAYSVLVELKAKLDANSVPQANRYVVVDSGFVAALAYDTRFIRLDPTDTLRTGITGRIMGFDVLVSNNVMTPGTSASPSAGADINDKVITAGVPGAISVAQQLTKTEALREEKRFADIVRGLNIYGGKVIRPAGLATATTTYAAGTG